MGKIDLRLRELGIILPEVPKPIDHYIAARRANNLIYTAGPVPVYNGVGRQIDIK